MHGAAAAEQFWKVFEPESEPLEQVLDSLTEAQLAWVAVE
jgi:hypothetical protein